PLNWHNQGADAGLYENGAIHAVRILAMSPTTDRHRGDHSGRGFFSHAMERLRILGEVPLRKFRGGKQPIDPDGHPDTSFLARIPADTAFTFQTIDRDGMVLNMSQTWHQLRPGEMRADCGGCHAHSQEPTDFAATAAAGADYKVWDLTETTPLVESRGAGAAGRQWDSDNSTGLRKEKKATVTVEYFRDIRPILEAHCVACHTRDWRKPAGNLVLDDDATLVQVDRHGKFPATYVRLALDEKAKFGHKPIGYNSWGYPNASRYIRKLQSRRSLLTWKLFGRRLDGFSNEDHPSEPEPGVGYFTHKGERVETDWARARYDIDYLGTSMPPPAAVAGTYKGPGGRAIKVPPLSDEVRRTLVRWIDLGCPIDRDPQYGWFLDDDRPVVTLAEPAPGHPGPLERVRIGMSDHGSGLDLSSFKVVASVDINGLTAGENLGPVFRRVSPGVWELELKKPLPRAAGIRFDVAVRDRQGNWTRLARQIRLPGDPRTARR
ncbi:MAG: hypothetical protein VB855_05245, partial [Pirellulaceae bacterium]